MSQDDQIFVMFELFRAVTKGSVHQKLFAFLVHNWGEILGLCLDYQEATLQNVSNCKKLAGLQPSFVKAIT